MLLDSTFWFDLRHERRVGQAGPAMNFLPRIRAVSISIITYGELAPDFERQDRLEEFLGGIQIHRLSPQIAWRASRIDRVMPQRLGENDLWIAATALTLGKRLVTADQAFERVPGLRVIDYRQA